MWYSFVLCGSVMLSQLEYATFETYINQRAATLHNIVDQFAYYANKAQPDRVCLPLDEDDSNVGTPGRLRIYGEASGSDAELVGVSYNAAGRWGGLNRDKHERRLEALASIAEDAGVPGIWIGETNGKFGVGSDEKEVGEVNRNSSIKCSPSNVEVDDLAQEIRDSFASDATPPSKPQDYTTRSGPSHNRHRRIGSKREGGVHSLVEIKRTGLDIDNWYPYTQGQRNDSRNYNLQIDAARRISARPLIINHPKRGFLDESDTVYFYDLNEDRMNTIRKQQTMKTFSDSRFSYDRTKATCKDVLSVIVGDKDWS
jgi:hypothetical protein